MTSEKMEAGATRWRAGMLFSGNGWLGTLFRMHHYADAVLGEPLVYCLSTWVVLTRDIAILLQLRKLLQCRAV